jgi:hypothetical protein
MLPVSLIFTSGVASGVNSYLAVLVLGLADPPGLAAPPRCPPATTVTRRPRDHSAAAALRRHAAARSLDTG